MPTSTDLSESVPVRSDGSQVADTRSGGSKDSKGRVHEAALLQVGVPSNSSELSITWNSSEGDCPIFYPGSWPPRIDELGSPSAVSGQSGSHAPFCVARSRSSSVEKADAGETRMQKYYDGETPAVDGWLECAETILAYLTAAGHRRENTETAALCNVRSPC